MCGCSPKKQKKKKEGKKERKKGRKKERENINIGDRPRSKAETHGLRLNTSSDQEVSELARKG